MTQDTPDTAPVEGSNDRKFTNAPTRGLDVSRASRRDGSDRRVEQGFAIASEAARYASTINAVSVPYYAGEFGAAVAFVRGALPPDLPRDLPRARAQSGVGPAFTRLPTRPKTAAATPPRSAGADRQPRSHHAR